MQDTWGTSDANRVGGRLRTSPIPMGFNRTPLHHKGLLLVGDSGGMVNPFNGEGISYAMEAGRLAADVVDRAFVTRRTATLDLYDRELRARIGGYYTLGRWFSHLVGSPTDHAHLHRVRDAVPPADGARAQAHGAPERPRPRGRQGRHRQHAAADGPGRMSGRGQGAVHGQRAMASFIAWVSAARPNVS